MSKDGSVRRIHNQRYHGFLAALIFTAAALAICISNSVFSSIYPKKINITDNTYTGAENCKAVSCTTGTLYYAGYDYCVHGNVAAHYYYALENGRCTIFLIDTGLAGGGDTPSTTLNGLTFSANIRHGDTYLRQILEYMASDLDWDYDSLSKYTNGYIISQYHYNIVWFVVMIMFTCAGAGLCVYFYITYRIERKKYQAESAGIAEKKEEE